jgi:hypothetical protein
MSFPEIVLESSGLVEPEIIGLDCFEEEAFWVAQLRAFTSVGHAADPRT